MMALNRPVSLRPAVSTVTSHSPVRSSNRAARTSVPNLMCSRSPRFWLAFWK